MVPLVNFYRNIFDIITSYTQTIAVLILKPIVTNLIGIFTEIKEEPFTEILNWSYTDHYGINIEMFVIFYLAIGDENANELISIRWLFTNRRLASPVMWDNKRAVTINPIQKIKTMIGTEAPQLSKTLEYYDRYNRDFII